MGYTREQSSNALIIHGTVEKALEALSGLHGNTYLFKITVRLEQYLKTITLQKKKFCPIFFD